MFADFIAAIFRFQKIFIESIIIGIPNKSDWSGDTSVFPPDVGKVWCTDFSLCNGKSGAGIYK